MELTVVQGDITQQQVDAVVNAANSRMRGGAGSTGRSTAPAARPWLEGLPQRFPTACRPGSRLDDGGDLPARWVIHVVGPNFAAGQRDRSLLTSCYANALHVADELGARTVAFPLVSAGIYGWPLETRSTRPSTRCSPRRPQWRRPAWWPSRPRSTS